MIRPIRTWVGISFATRYLHKTIRPSSITQKNRNSSSMSVQQPPWSIPEKQVEEPVLRIYNSLTKTKVSMVFLLFLNLF
jgi:hypothetical protein